MLSWPRSNALPIEAGLAVPVRSGWRAAPRAAVRGEVVLFATVAVRWALVAAALLVGREALFDWLDATGRLGPVVATVAWLGATPISRALTFGAFLVLLSALAVCADRAWVPALRGRTAPLVASASLAIALASVPSYWRGVAVVMLGATLALGFSPRSIWIRALASARRWSLAAVAVGAVPGLAEIAAWRWLAAEPRRRSGPTFRALAEALERTAVVAPACVILAIGVDGRSLVDVERHLRHDPAVERIAPGDASDLVLDPARRRLYAVGHGTDRVRSFPTRGAATRPRESRVSTGGAEFMGFSAERRELYVHASAIERLLVLDADKLSLKTSIPLPRIARGDAWVRYVPSLDAILIASEADRFDGFGFVVVDRASGQVIDRGDLDPGGGVLVREDRPWAYLSFFRRHHELLAYDLGSNRIRARAVADPHTAQLAYWPARDEILLTSPTRGVVERFDAETLAPRGEIATLRGGRAVAIDSRRGWLLCGSMTSGRLAVVDLASGSTVTSFYLGPWLRAIRLDESEGVAYVASADGLYRVAYAAHAAGGRGGEARS